MNNYIIKSSKIMIQFILYRNSKHSSLLSIYRILDSMLGFLIDYTASDSHLSISKLKYLFQATY